MSRLKARASETQKRQLVPEVTDSRALIMSDREVSSSDDQENVEESEDESDDGAVDGVETDISSEQDDEEQELERLVFGGSESFRKNLKGFTTEEAEEADIAADDDTGLAGVDDAQLFFADTGDDAAAPAPVAAKADEETDVLRFRLPAAWEDSDDERMLVSLAAVPRLRKLRRTEAEDLVTGKEYSRRLRQQFEILNPTPEWAHTTKPAKKKRRLSDDQASNSEASDVDMDGEGDSAPSVAPLSDLLRDANSLVRKSGASTGEKKRKFRPEVIDIQRAKDIGVTQPSAVTSLSFHPTLPLLLSSGPSSTLYLHQIAASPPAPAPNPLLTSLHIRNTPLSTTAFHPTDSRIFLSARRRYFHIWDLSTGQVEKISRIYGHQHEQRSMERFKLSPGSGTHMALLGSTKKGGGVVNILDARTLQWTAQVRVESARGGVADFAWWRDGSGLVVVAKNGEVTEWSLRDQKVVARWNDEGAVGSTVIALGGTHEFAKSPFGTDRWVAIGSSSGIVNIYDRRAWLATPATQTTKSSTADHQPIPLSPSPTRALAHLTTPTSVLAFSPDGQILAIASKWKRDAMRLVHLPTCTVFKNWPTSSTPLGRITSVAFAEGSIVEGESDVGVLLAVGNEQGKIRMWEVR